MARRLEVIIVGDASSLERALGKASTAANRSFTGISRGAKIASAALLGGLAFAAKAGFSELMEGERVSAQTAAALKSTGGAANVTAKEVEKLAQTISKKTSIDDEQIQAAENWLLTFKNVRNEVGAGNDIFTQATKATADLAVAQANAKGTAVDLSGASNMLGKALNDPEKGLTALGRAGVQFTAAQKDAIKAMVESGDIMGAQKLILAELTNQVGGSAEAYGNTLTGSVNKAKNAAQEMAASLTASLAPAVVAIGGAVGAATGFLEKHQTATKAVIVAMAAMAAGVFIVEGAMRAYRAAVLAAAAAQKVFNLALKANPIGLVITGAALLTGGLYALSRSATTTKEKFDLAATAARNYKLALDGLSSSSRTLEDAHLRVTQAELGVQRARLALKLATETSRPGSLAFKEAQLALTQAEIEQKRATEDLTAAQRASTTAKQNASATTKDFSGRLAVLSKMANETARAAHAAARGSQDFSSRITISLYQNMIAKLQGIASNAGGTSTELGRAALKAVELARGIASLNDKTITITTVFRQVGSAIAGVGQSATGRAGGGPVQANRAFVVGEKGPELFVPRVNGTIVPNGGGRGMAGGGAGVTVNVTVNGALMGSSVPQVAKIIRRELLRTQGRNTTLGFT